MILERFEEVEGDINNPNLKKVIATIAEVGKDFEGYHTKKSFNNIMIQLASVYNDRNSTEAIAAMTDINYKAPGKGRAIKVVKSKSVNENKSIIDDCPDCPKVAPRVVGGQSKSLTSVIKTKSKKVVSLNEEELIAKIDAIEVNEEVPKSWQELSARFDDDVKRLREYAVSLGLTIGGKAGSEFIAKKLFQELS